MCVLKSCSQCRCNQWTRLPIEKPHKLKNAHCALCMFALCTWTHTDTPYLAHNPSSCDLCFKLFCLLLTFFLSFTKLVYVDCSQWWVGYFFFIVTYCSLISKYSRPKTTLSLEKFDSNSSHLVFILHMDGMHATWKLQPFVKIQIDFFRSNYENGQI